MHGGNYPRGVDHPSYRTGRYSKYAPAHLIEKYTEALDDPELLALRDEVALLDARLSELLERVDSGDAGTLWPKLQAAWADARSGDEIRQIRGTEALNRLIEQGATDHLAWEEIHGIIDRRTRVVTSERQRLVQMQQMITAEQALVLLGKISESIKMHVHDPVAVRRVVDDLNQLADLQPSSEPLSR